MAAADCAQGKGNPPPALKLLWQCERFGALPEGGGLYDQPARTMQDMIAAGNVYAAVKSWRASKNWQAWAKENPQAWEVVQVVTKLQKEHRRGRR